MSHDHWHGGPRPIWLKVRIDVQDDFRDFLPVGASAVGVEKAEVRNYVLFIIACGHTGFRRFVGNVRIKWRLLHDVSSTHGALMRGSIAAVHPAWQSLCLHRVMPAGHHDRDPLRSERGKDGLTRQWPVFESGRHP